MFFFFNYSFRTRDVDFFRYCYIFSLNYCLYCSLCNNRWHNSIIYQILKLLSRNQFFHVDVSVGVKSYLYHEILKGWIIDTLTKKQGGLDMIYLQLFKDLLNLKRFYDGIIVFGVDVKDCLQLSF